MDNLTINLWKIQNRGKYEAVYKNKGGFDPEQDWYDSEFVGLKYNNEVFPCKIESDGIEQIINKSPESVATFDIDMDDFCKSYVNGLLLAMSNNHGKKQVCFSKSNSELFYIVIGKHKVDKETMWDDIKLKELKDPVYCMVYSFIRDNMNIFAE